MSILTIPEIKFGGSAFYRIVVQGALGSEWKDRIAGMQLTLIERGTGTAHTELYGLVRDQAELAAVLETLHQLHLPIIEVQQTKKEQPDS